MAWSHWHSQQEDKLRQMHQLRQAFPAETVRREACECGGCWGVGMWGRWNDNYVHTINVSIAQRLKMRETNFELFYNKFANTVNP